MQRKILKNKPLVEAIFEIRWQLEEAKPGYEVFKSSNKDYSVKIDPHYKLLVGRLYEQFIDEYPFHEELPAANMPDEISPYIVKHRFRKAENEWPLIQIGPGILTVNDTESYVWEDFEIRVEKALNSLFKLYPKAQEKLIINSLSLRYIDAIAFNYEENYIFDFLRDQMKTEINLHNQLFENTGVEKPPLKFDLKFDFKTSNPKGVIFIRFGRGRNRLRNVDSLIWETTFRSGPKEVPKSIMEVSNWITEAHELTDDWFFKIIDGELLRRFE